MPQSSTQKEKEKMRRILRDLAVLLILLSTSCLVAQAALVRGRLLHGQNNTAAGVAVTVWCQAYGRSQASFSGGDGMYYIPNVPPGQYTLEVWAIPNNPPMTFVIYV